MYPTGPSGQGRGWGRGRGGCLQNQLLTSKETAEFIAEAVERADKKEKIKMEKDDFCKKVLAQKSKRERMAKKGGKGRAEGVGGGRGSKK